MYGYGAAAGLLMGLGGAAIGAQGNRAAKRDMNALANLPGVDIDQQARDALAFNEGNFGQMSDLTGRTNQFNYDEIAKLLDESIPGYRNMQDKQSAAIQSMLAGEIPQDVADQIQRSAAVRALGGGYSGSGMHGALMARDLGLNSLGMITQGMGAANSFIGSTRQNSLPNMMGVQSLFGPSAADRINVRSNERTQKLNILAAAAGMPGESAAWGNFLSSTGGMLMGAGIQGLMPKVGNTNGTIGGSN